MALGRRNLEKNAKKTVINAVEVVMTEEAVTIVVEVEMKEEKKEGIIQVKIGIVLNVKIVIIHSAKTVTAVKHLGQVQVVQALDAMKGMVVEMRGEVVMTVEEVATTEEVVMTAEAVIVAVILTVHQTEMVQITVMTGNVQSVKIAISLSVQNVIAVD